MTDIMPQEQPLITIGITCFNAEHSIERAVLSALSQDWSNFEIIIVDDFSTDNSLKILNKLKTKHSKITIINHETNKGVATSRNSIIKHANGKFIAFFDDDDNSEPTRLSKQYKRITEYENLYAYNNDVICHTNRTQIYPDGSKRIEKTVGLNNGICPNGKDFADRILFGKPTNNGYGSTATCSQMARTSTYKRLGYFDENITRGEDTEFNARAAINGAHFIGINEPLVTQYMTLTSDKALETEQENLIYILNKHKQYISSKTSYDFCISWTKLKYIYLKNTKLKFILKLIHIFLNHPILTTQRLLWALPNISLNNKTANFYKGDKGKHVK